MYTEGIFLYVLYFSSSLGGARIVTVNREESAFPIRSFHLQLLRA